MRRDNPIATALTLADLPDGSAATVQRVLADGSALDAMQLHRLRELGFLPGEPVQVVRRGPGGREPLAVQVGDTLFALRLAEARCVLVA